MEIKNYFAQDAQGNIIPSANCYLYLPGTTNLATGLVDGNGTPISNPFHASGMGKITFGAPNGVYDLRVALGARDWTIKVQCADIVQAMDVMDSILGSHAENPTTRNNGQPLEPGDETWSSTDKQPYWWNGTAWVALNSSAQQLEERLSGPDGGAKIVTFLADGPGSVIRNANSKMRDTVSPKDKGAKGDGTVDDSAAINTANAASADVDTSSGTYKLLNTVNYGAATYRSGIAVQYNSAASFAWRLGSGAAVEGGSFTATGGVAFDVLAGSIGASLRNAIIKNTSSTNATGVNLNAPDIKDFSLCGAAIDTEGYGLLTNSAGSIDGLVISDSFIQSKADCIELNAPGASHKHVVINGCVLRADSTRSDHAAGFAVGIAGVKGAAATGLVIAESRWEAFHQEDATEQLVISGVAARDVKGDFYRGQTDSEHGTLGGRGAVVVGTSAKSYGTNLGNAGIYMIYNLNGSLPGANSSCNRYEGFDWGILSGRADMMADSNVLDRCGVAAVASDGGGFIYGSNLALSTGTLAKTKEGTYIGGVWSTTVPTVVLDTSTHVPRSIGTVLAEFSYRGKITALPASTTTPIDLFLLPKLMCGRLIVRVRGSGVYIYGSADVLWDGATLTVTKALKDFSGTIDWSGKTFTAVDGQLRMSVVNVSAARDVTTDVIFKGEYYK